MTNISPPDIYPRQELISILSKLRYVCSHVWHVGKSKGWKDNGQIPIAVMTSNLHGEVSELWEAYRSGKLNEPCDKAHKMKELGIEPLTCIEEELADIVIRAMDTAQEYGVDLGRAIVAKDAYNQTRPHRHGGKIV